MPVYWFPCIAPVCGTIVIIFLPSQPAGCASAAPAVQNAKKAMEAKQEELKQTLAAKQPGFANELAYNYMVLQIFDLLSLYFCCDGYAARWSI